MRKIIFLDHDGVICLADNFGSRRNKNGHTGMNSDIHSRFDNFDRKAVSVLNSIIESTGCELVVSSDWRFWATLDEMGQYYISQGIKKAPIDYTPRQTSQSKLLGGFDVERPEARSYEIKEWLSGHPEVSHWVAVDDLDMSERFSDASGNYRLGLKNFVHTPRSREGIKQSGIKEKIEFFLNSH
jgi:hypothetical protein